MFAGFSETLSIDEIAELWSRETDEPASIIRRILLKAFQPELGSLISGEAGISRDLLLAYCKEQRIQFPKFWGRAAAKIVSSNKAEKACEKWIRELRESGYKPRNKKALLEEARKKFEKLSKRGFDRAWANEAHPDWQKVGRKPKSFGS